jgi:hypothetical protein
MSSIRKRKNFPFNPIKTVMIDYSLFNDAFLLHCVEYKADCEQGILNDVEWNDHGLF